MGLAAVAVWPKPGATTGRLRGPSTFGTRQGDVRVEGLLRLSRGIDAVNFRIGKVLSWLILIVVLISATNATIRKVFDTSSNAWLELQWMLFGAVFLLCSPWTLLSNEHIRIDIVNGMLPKRWRDVIDVVGHLFFLLPLTIVMIITSVPFFLRSFLTQRAVDECGRPAAMAGQVPDPRSDSCCCSSRASPSSSSASR